MSSATAGDRAGGDPAAAAAAAFDAEVREALRGTFRIEAAVCRGPRGVVYTARPAGGEARVALKILAWPEGAGAEVPAAFLERLERDASLHHAHIVPVQRCGVTESFGWYAMEFQRGRPLAAMLASEGPLEREGCQRVAQQIAAALDHAHRRGLTHGNLTPANVFVDEAGWVRVADFGVRQCFASLAATTGRWELAGSAPFLAPEQRVLRGSVAGPAADQYALAALLCACQGIVPANAGAADGAGDRARPPAEQRWRRLPGHVRAAFERALEPSAYQRFPGVLEFVAALEDPRTGADPRAGPSPGGFTAWNRRLPLEPAPVAPRPPRRWRTGLPLALIALAAGWVGLLQLQNAVRRQAAAATADTPAGDSAAAGAALAPPGDSALDGVAPRADSGPPASPQPAASLGQTPAPQPTTTAPQHEASPPAARQISAAPPVVARRQPAPRTQRAVPPPPARPSPPAPSVAPPPREPAKLYVSSQPWGYIYLDQKLVGHTPASGLPVHTGVHVLRIARDGFQPYEQLLQLSPGESLWITDVQLRRVKSR